MNFAKVLGACTVAGVAGYYTYLIPHTVALEKLRRNVTRYRLEKEVRLPKRVYDRLNEVLNDLRVPPETGKHIKLFDVFGFDTYNCGLISSKYGAILGVPANFAYKDTAMINKEDIKLFDLPVDWTRDDARLFLNGLVISDQAQKSALAFNVLKIQSEEPFYQALMAGAWAGNTCGVYYLFRNNIRHRKFFAAALIAVSYTCWIFTKDYIARLVEKACDDKILQLSPEYAAGIKEYLDTIIHRNLAARSLLGEYGQKLFTEKGDFRFLIRSRCVPITERRDFFASKVSKLVNREEM